jgi:hypothetical protein
MSRNLPARFWFEAITAVIGLTLFVVTLFTREWFELLTGLDPDGGNGALELALAFALLAIAAASSLAARREYRRAH